MKIELSKKEFDKFLKKNPLLSSIILGLLLLNLAQFVYFYRENQKLKSQILSANAKIADLKSDLGNTKEVVTSVSQYFEEKGNVTLGGLIETVYRLEDTIGTLNDNVDVANSNYNKMNTNLEDLYTKTSSLQRQIEIIANYLFR